MNKIWVCVETCEGKIAQVVLELLNKANELASSIDEYVSVEAVFPGDLSEEQVMELGEYGADIVYAVRDSRLKKTSPSVYIQVITELVLQNRPQIFLFGSTAVGNTLGPAIAARLRTGMAAHCVDLRVNGRGQLVSSVPAFGGDVIGEIFCPDTIPQMASVKAGVFDSRRIPKDIKVFYPDLTRIIDGLKSSFLEHVRDIPAERSGVPLPKAKVVVCGGFGVANEESWKLVNSVAGKLGGATACTRPVVDAGLATEEQMIGTSGVNVKPEVYIGFGVSGATQHLCGIGPSKLVIGVNKDRQANIFNYSDICMVDDAQEVLKALDRIIV